MENLQADGRPKSRWGRMGVPRVRGHRRTVDPTPAPGPHPRHPWLPLPAPVPPPPGQPDCCLIRSNLFGAGPAPTAAPGAGFQLFLHHCSSAASICTQLQAPLRPSEGLCSGKPGGRASLPLPPSHTHTRQTHLHTNMGPHSDTYSCTETPHTLMHITHPRAHTGSTEAGSGLRASGCADSGRPGLGVGAHLPRPLPVLGPRGDASPLLALFCLNLSCLAFPSWLMVPSIFSCGSLPSTRLQGRVSNWGTCCLLAEF